MNIFRRAAYGLLPLALSLLAAGGQPSHAGQTQNVSQSRPDSSPLIDKVRAATARFRDINVALAEGWVQGTPCVSGPDTGAMGVHFVMPSRIGNFVLPRFPDDPGHNADAAFNFMRRRGILTRQMGGYGLPQHLRITIGTGEEMERVARRHHAKPVETPE